MDRIGSICVVDLETVCARQGRADVPYPLGRSRPVGSAWLLSLDESPIASRVQGTEVDAFDRWAATGARADIWVSCRVHYPRQDLADTRIHAFRAGDSGYLAEQRPDDEFVDIVDIWSLSAYDLGRAIADSVELTGPGSHSRVVIPGLRDHFRPESAAELEHDDEIAIGVRDSALQLDIVVADDDVTAVATVQSHCTDSAQPGLDLNKDFEAWVRVRNDGEYIFSGDSSGDLSSAVPMTREVLRRRIDDLIVGDVRTVRKLRGGED